MKISEAIDFFKNLVDSSIGNAEMKTCLGFLKVLNNLDNRDWAEEDLQKLEGKLKELELDAQTTNRRKYLRKKYTALTAFLQKEFSLITQGSYTTMGMVLGMVFGQGLGMAFGVAIDPTMGIALGLTMGTGMGMALGIAIGAYREATAKKEGRVLG